MMEFEYQRTSQSDRKAILSWGQQQLRRHQLSRFNRLLKAVVGTNQFYTDKLANAIKGNPVLASLDALPDLPFTRKQDLIDSEDGAGFARNLTFDHDAYSRFHRTSGTRGQPMIVLDTENDWNWWMEAWQYVLDSADLRPCDRVVMAFSFGPFIGFWSAFDAVVERGAMVVPTGAMSSQTRLELIQSIGATVVFCTPSYALHLAHLALKNGMELRDSQVDRIVVAGEPGGSIPAVRSQIESAWNATVIDHCGASEVGPWGIADQAATGILVNEAEFIAEFLPLESEQAWLRPDLSQHAITSKAADTKIQEPVYELVLTGLGRIGSPVIRYRTGDLVRPQWPSPDDVGFVKLVGGVIGRVDDMMIIRGVNVFPSSIEQVVRSFPDVVEYRATAFNAGVMSQLKIEVELHSNTDHSDLVSKISQAFETQLGFRIDVEAVASGTLPRFEAKGQRFVDNR